MGFCEIHRVRWRVYFHGERVAVPRGHSDPVVLRHQDVLERAAARPRWVGQPFLLDPLGAADLRVNSWFDSDDIRGLGQVTWRKYAYSLVVWLSFLWAYGRPWYAVVEAFKVWRMLDAHNPRSVESGTYRDNLTALRLFYGWAAAEFQGPNPIRVRRTRGTRWDGTPAEKPVTAPKAARDRDVQWFDPAGYERYRDCGLVGLTLEGDEDRGWRGRSGQRNAAFADLLYGSGLRLEKGGSLLLVELPPDDPGRGFYTCHMAEQCAKGKIARAYWMPRKALLPVLDYCEGERATAVGEPRPRGAMSG